MINDLEINLQMKFVESALSGSTHEFEILLSYDRPKQWDFEYVSYPIYFYLITQLFDITYEPNANKVLITKHGKENSATVIFNLKAKHLNKKGNVIVQVKNSFGVVCHIAKFMTEVYTPNLYD